MKHMEELSAAVKEGWEAVVFFVVQMEGVDYFTPNMDTHPAFGEALKKAAAAGVRVTAWDCHVEQESISIRREVPVVLGERILYEIRKPLVDWYRKNKRELPWREHPDAYRVWVSEIMLQQTRVEAVKPYYERFLAALPDVKALAEAPEDVLLKLWEGLGYYNRVRNMQKAARQIMEEYGGVFPDRYEDILSLSGIGSYTAGAVSAFAYGLPRPAVDGNVLRVVSRLSGQQGGHHEGLCEAEDGGGAAGGDPRRRGPATSTRGSSSLGRWCVSRAESQSASSAPWPTCAGQRERGSRVSCRCGQRQRNAGWRRGLSLSSGTGTRQPSESARPKGLLAGLYELPNVEGHLTMEEAVAYSKDIGLVPVRVKKLGEARHIFSHVEWDMVGYLVQVDELEKSCREEMIFIHPRTAQEEYAIPSAFEKYAGYLKIRLGNERYRE